MKKLYTIFVAMQIISHASAQIAGTLDSSFSNDGLASYDWTENSAQHLIEQPDGKLLISVAKNDKYFIARINNDSTYDAGFGINGVVEDSIPGSPVAISAMHLDANDNIIISLYSYGAASSFFAYARYLSNGDIDSTFGTNGFVMQVPSTDMHYRNFIFPTTGNQYLIVESININPPDFNTTISRLENDGSIDSTYGNAGTVLIPDLMTEGATKMLSDELILYGVETFASGYSLMSFTSNGAIDSSYGINGKVLEPFMSGTSLVGMFADSADNVFTTQQYGFPNSTWRISKFDSTGTKDAGFGVAGDKDFPNNDRQIFSLVFQPDGKILAGGIHLTGVSGSENLLQRWLPDGSPDATFGNGGEVLFTSGGNEFISVLNLSNSGKIYSLTNVYLPATFNFYFMVARFNNDITIGINDMMHNQDNLIVYPNPASDKINIRHNNTSANTEIIISDLTGKVVLKSSGLKENNGEREISTAGLPAGFYTVSLKGQQIIVSTKFMITR